MSKLKIESALWKLIVNNINLQNIFVLVKNIIHDFFVLLVYFDTFIEVF